MGSFGGYVLTLQYAFEASTHFRAGSAVTVVFLVLSGVDSKPTSILYEVWGYFATGTIVLQWLPQIYTTYKMKVCSFSSRIA